MRFPTKVTWLKYAVSPIWEMRNSVCRLLFIFSHSENNENARSYPSARNLKSQNFCFTFFLLEKAYSNLITDGHNFLTRTVNLWRRLKINHLRKIVLQKKILQQESCCAPECQKLNFPDTAPYINFVSQLCCHSQSTRGDARTFRKWDWIFVRLFVFYPSL